MIRKAVIIAGGAGTRLRPVTYEIPKPLVPVQGRPIATWLARWLAAYGVREVLMSIPPQWEKQFQKWRAELGAEETWAGLPDAQNIAQDFHIDLWSEPEPMGTMGALVHHLSARLGDEPVIITNGDELKGLSLQQLEDFHRTQRDKDQAYRATIALTQVPNPWDYGVAELEGELIKRFHEKPAVPPSNLINSGLYVIEPRVFKEVDASKHYLMFEKDLFPQLAAQHRLGGCPLAGPWFDCGTLERWEKAIHEWREGSVA